MITLWNPSSQPQNLVATFYDAQGSERYKLSVNLQAYASMNIDMAQLIALGEPDSSGRVIPASVTQGSVVISNLEGLRGKMKLSLNAAVFNVQTATCGATCLCCYGVCYIYTSDDPPDPQSVQCHFYAYYTDGTDQDITDQSTWSSTNTSVASVNDSGLVTGDSPGEAEIDVYATVDPAGALCSCAWQCNEPMQVSAYFSIHESVWTGKLNSSTSTLCYYATSCPDNTTASCPPYAEVEDLYIEVGSTKECFFLGLEYETQAPLDCK